MAAIGPASSSNATGKALIPPLRLRWMTMDREADVRNPPVSISSRRSCIEAVETTACGMGSEPVAERADQLLGPAMTRPNFILGIAPGRAFDDGRMNKDLAR